MSTTKSIRTAARSRDALRWQQVESALLVPDAWCKARPLTGALPDAEAWAERSAAFFAAEYQRDAIASANSGSETFNGGRS